MRLAACVYVQTLTSTFSFQCTWKLGMKFLLPTRKWYPNSLCSSQELPRLMSSTSGKCLLGLPLTYIFISRIRKKLLVSCTSSKNLIVYKHVRMAAVGQNMVHWPKYIASGSMRVRNKVVPMQSVTFRRFPRPWSWPRFSSWTMEILNEIVNIYNNKWQGVPKFDYT